MNPVALFAMFTVLLSIWSVNLMSNPDTKDWQDNMWWVLLLGFLATGFWWFFKG